MSLERLNKVAEMIAKQLEKEYPDMPIGNIREKSKEMTIELLRITAEKTGVNMAKK